MNIFKATVAAILSVTLAGAALAGPSDSPDGATQQLGGASGSVVTSFAMVDGAYVIVSQTGK